MSLSSRILRGSSLNAIDLVMRMGVMFLMTPFMISHLGLDRYGVWVVLTTAISFLELLDGGVTLSGTRFLARALGQNDPHLYTQTAGTLAWVYHRIAWICLLGTVVLIWAGPALAPASVDAADIRWILMVLGISLTIRFFLRIHLVILKSHVRYDLIVGAGMAKLVVQSGLILWSLKAGHGLLALALIQISSDLLDQFLVVAFSRRSQESPIETRLHNRPLLRELLVYSATNFLNTLGQFLRSRVDPLILSATAGVAVIPIYSMGTRMLTLFSDLVNAILGGPLLAGFCQVEGASGMESLRKKFLFAMKFSVPFVSAASIGLFFCGPPFLERWLGESFRQSGSVLQLLTFPFALWLMQWPGYNLLLALNRQSSLMKAIFAAGLFNVIASWILALKIGLFGVVIATVIEMAILSGAWVPCLVAGAANMSLTFYYLRTLALPAIAGALPATLFHLLTPGLLRPDYASLLIAGSANLVLSAGAMWGCIWIFRGNPPSLNAAPPPSQHP